jgi:phosphatidylglycerol---prolipoprotein diacylglyceryl transferase
MRLEGTMCALGAWVHDLNPVILRLSEAYQIRWYGVSYIVGFAIAYLVLRWLSRRGVTPIPPHRVADAMVVLIASVLIGGRLGYVVFYRPSLLVQFSGSPPWWGLVKINEGGMASHGAIVGVLIGGWIISRGWRDDPSSPARLGVCPWRHVMDMLALMCPFGLFLGRVANFVNSELLGRVVAGPGEASPWWSVKYPSEILGDHAPAWSEPQQQELLGLLQTYARAGERTLMPAAERLVSAIQHGSMEAKQALEPLLAARVPSQLIAAMGEGLIMGLVVWLIGRKPRWPGTVGCAFLISYGLARITNEIWRLPDAHLKVPMIAGLTRGQWLSVAMVVGGLAVLGWIWKTGGAKMGGWQVPGRPSPRESSAAAWPSNDIKGGD